MAISGASCSNYTSSYLSPADTNKLRQEEKSQHLATNLNANDSSNKEPTEYIFRGELLEEAFQNNGFRDKREQTIAPANQTAINQYEDNNKPVNEPLIFQQPGSILDAYA